MTYSISESSIRLFSLASITFFIFYASAIFTKASSQITKNQPNDGKQYRLMTRHLQNTRLLKLTHTLRENHRRKEATMGATAQTHPNEHYPHNPHIRPASAHITHTPTQTHITRYNINAESHPRLSDINEKILLRTLLGIALAVLICIALWLLLFFGISQGSTDSTATETPQSLSL